MGNESQQQHLVWARVPTTIRIPSTLRGMALHDKRATARALIACRNAGHQIANQSGKQHRLSNNHANGIMLAPPAANGAVSGPGMPCYANGDSGSWRSIESFNVTGAKQLVFQ